MLTHIDKISRSCLLITIGLILGYFENILIYIPVPGVKIGLSNIVLLYAVLKMDAKWPVIIGVLKSLLSGLLFSGVTTIIYSVVSVICSVLIMSFLFRKLFPDKISIYGISISGSIVFNIVQIFVASVYMKTQTVFYYLPYFVLISIFSGFITAFIIKLNLKRFEDKYEK